MFTPICLLLNILDAILLEYDYTSCPHVHTAALSSVLLSIGQQTY